MTEPPAPPAGAPVTPSGRRRTPPWWPADEPWPPSGPPWHGSGGPWHTGARRFRRRFIVLAAGFVVAAFVISSALSRGVGRGPGDRRPSYPSVFVIGLVVAIVAAIVSSVIYRRFGEPTGRLLEAAERLGLGDYTVRVDPGGPGDLRRLMATFNQSAERLQQAEESRRRFLADVTHELRTPLSILQAGLEAQLDGVHARDDAHLASLHDETLVLERLIDDLHTLARSDAGELTIHREPTAIGVVIDDVVRSMSSAATHKGVELRSNPVAAPGVDAAIPILELDPNRVRQVLSNIVANAVRHTPQGGHVEIDTSSGPGIVTITVTDDGSGIAVDPPQQIFDRFVKAADSTGTGLGLSIARDLVLAHGGTISAANRTTAGQRTGAIITITLPTS